MIERFRPYDGSEPYIFVSYSHANSDYVLSAAYALFKAEYRVWYDEGIPAGSDWPVNIENHLRAADTVLFFASEKSLSSPNCMSEISTASRMGKKIICAGTESLLSVLIDGGENQENIAINKISEWREYLCNAKKLVITDDTNFTYSLLEAFTADTHLKGDYQVESHNTIKRNFAGIVVLTLSFVVLIGVICGTWALLTGRLPNLWSPPTSISEDMQEPEPTPVPTIDPSVFSGLIKNNITFPDSLQERAVRAATGIPEGEINREMLVNVDSLYLCGTLFTTNPDAISYDSDWKVNNVLVSRGNVKDLSLISEMYALEKLYIVNENINSINSLSELPVLQMLSVAGNPINTLDGINGFSSLNTLDISHTEITDLGQLSSLPSLRKVYVSSDMLPINLDSNAQYEVILVK